MLQMLRDVNDRLSCDIVWISLPIAAPPAANHAPPCARCGVADAPRVLVGLLAIKLPATGVSASHPVIRARVCRRDQTRLTGFIEREGFFFQFSKPPRVFSSSSCAAAPPRARAAREFARPGRFSRRGAAPQAL